MKSFLRSFLFCVFAALCHAQISGTDYIVRCTNNTTAAGGGYSTLTAVGSAMGWNSGATALQPGGDGSQLTGLTKTQVGLANVDNTSDANKPLSTADTNALALKANAASPTFTGTVTLPSGITFIAPALGTPASGTLTNCTFPSPARRRS